MADAKHTPGPWFEGERNQAGMAIYAHFPDQKFGHITGAICCVWNHLYLPPQEANANAALILAAPDLFKALSFAVECIAAATEFRLGNPAYEQAEAMGKAALAKASA